MTTILPSVMSSTASTPQGVHSPMGLGGSEPSSPRAENSTALHTQFGPEVSNGEDTELLSVSWNQDYGCFSAGTNRGFRIYNCDPFKETFKRDFKNGGFGIVEMLFRCNILALVGGGENPQYPPNKVMIWDDHQSRCIGELAFRSEVRAVKLRRDRIVVVLEHKIYVYNFSDLKLLNQIETLANPRGLCILSHQQNTSVLACPGLHRGQVRIEHFGLKMTKFINAHDSHIACFTLTNDGLLLATASTKGTLIRIFNTMDGTRLQEVRRGVDRADVYSIALSPSIQWLAVSSDKGTVHVFSLRVRVVGEDSATHPNAGQGPLITQQNSSTSVDALIAPNTGANPSSSLAFMKGVLPKYFSSEWSFAQFHLREDTRVLVAFGGQNSVIIVGMDGSFYRCTFDPIQGGEMLQQEYFRFLKPDSKHKANSNVRSCVSLLQSCATNGSLNPGLQIHSWIIINGLQQTPFLVTSLINMYSKCRQPWEAVKLFYQTTEPNVFAWNALIAGLVHCEYFSDAIGFYHKMRASHVNGDKFTYPCVLKACSNLQDFWEGKKVHSGLAKTGLQSDPFISASLINFYLKFDVPDDARKVFDKMSERDVVLWNSMITGYAQSGMFVEALQVFDVMVEEGIELSKYTITGILSVLATIGDVQRGRRIHNYIRERGFLDDVAVCNSLIDMYGKCKSFEAAGQVFDEMPQRDIVSWNSILSCSSHSVYHDKTLALFDKMRTSSVSPDAITVAAVLPSIAHLAALRHGKELHGYTIVNAMGRDDVFAQNAIMDMYVKCGSLSEGYLVFDNILEKDLVSWNIMITGYGMHGNVKAALEMFERMQMAGMMPDEITFVGVLSACSHAGFFDCGVDLYRQMHSKYGVVPTVEHYACVVDMLGRAGRLHEAYSILRDMHFEPNAVVWRAFLGACRLHGDTTLGEMAACQLLELEPGHCGNYVLLSNIYSDAGRYEEVCEIRKEMKDRGVKKMPGCSWIELNDGVYAFSNGHRANLESDQIYELLHVLVGMVREHGYEPDMGLALAGT